MNFRIKTFSLSVSALFCALCFTTSLFSSPATKSIVIEGANVLSKNQLDEIIDISKKDEQSDLYEYISRKLISYYHANGFYLVKTFLVEETDSKIRIFLDEGHIGRIVVKNHGIFRTIQIKLEISLKNKIYNRNAIDEQLERIKKEYGFISAEAILVKAEDYSKSPVQIERPISVPVIGEKRIPFLSRYDYSYHLEIILTPPAQHTRDSIVLYGLKTNYTKGFIPWVIFNKKSLIKKDDNGKIKSSVGIYYLLNMKPGERPHWTYIDALASYSTPPIIKDSLSPRLSSYFYRSRTGRKDLGLKKYEYALVKGTVEPGFSFLDFFRAYIGLGIEKYYFFAAERETDSEKNFDVGSKDNTWSFAKVAIEGDNMLLKNILKYFDTEISYSYYKNHDNFHEISATVDLYQKTRGYYQLYSKMEYIKLWGKVPFSHEAGVSNSAFRGFSGKSYYSRNAFKNSNSLSISIYRDYLYAGVFLDAVFFEGSGHDLRGFQTGFTAGPTLKILLLDQFSLDLLAGRDILCSSRKGGWNFAFSLYKSF